MADGGFGFDVVRRQRLERGINDILRDITFIVGAVQKGHLMLVGQHIVDGQFQPGHRAVRRKLKIGGAGGLQESFQGKAQVVEVQSDAPVCFEEPGLSATRPWGRES